MIPYSMKDKVLNIMVVIYTFLICRKMCMVLSSLFCNVLDMICSSEVTVYYDSKIFYKICLFLEKGSRRF